MIHSDNPMFTRDQIGLIARQFEGHFVRVGIDSCIYEEDGSCSCSDEDVEADGFILGIGTDSEDDSDHLTMKDEYGIETWVPWQRINSIYLLAHREVFGE